MHDTAPSHPRVRRSPDRRLAALELLSRELKSGALVVLRSTDVSARWSLDVDTADHLLDHLAEEGLLGRRDDGAYVARSVTW